MRATKVSTTESTEGDHDEDPGKLEMRWPWQVPQALSYTSDVTPQHRTFYQVHECEGFRAKVTIEWNIPATVDETVIAHRIAAAVDIADVILGFSGKRMRDMVQAMRGYTVPPT